MITQNFDLNIIPNSAPVVIHVSQYDNEAGRLVASLYNGDIAFNPTGTVTYSIQGSKPDGHGFQYGAASRSGNVVTCNLTSQMTAVAGITKCQIVVEKGTDIIGSFVFFLDVQPAALPADADMSESEYQLVEQMIEQAREAAARQPIIGQNGNWWIWDFTNSRYTDTGIDATISITIADVNMLAPDADPYVTNTGTNTDPIYHLYIPRGKGITSIAKTDTQGLVDTYTVTYSDGTTYTYTVTNGKTAYQSAVEGGYSEGEEQFESDLANFKVWKEDAEDAADTAVTSGAIANTKANQARQYALDAEAWAVGERNGQPVTSPDVTYENNSEWYADRAQGSAATALALLGQIQTATENALEQIDDALDSAAPTFNVDLTNGHLYYEGGRFDFVVNQAGHLMYELTV